MKQLLSTLLLLCLFVGLFVMPTKADAPLICVVNNPDPADRLHLRSEPRTDAASLGKYYNGTPVSVLEDNTGGWTKVYIGGDVGGAEGYMQTQFLAFGDDCAKVKLELPLYQSTSSGWNLYNSPRANQNDFRTFGLENIEVLGIMENWWHVRIREHTGYVPSDAPAIVNNPNSNDRLNLREKPQTNAVTLGKYYNGTVVIMLSGVQNGWVKVQIGYLQGYMESKFLLINAWNDTVTIAIPTVTVKTTVGRLHLRERPSQSSDSLGLYDNGTTVQVLGISALWCHVMVERKAGFMMTVYLNPKLSFEAAGSGSGSINDNTGNTGNAATGGLNGSWGGPVGAHHVASWPISPTDYSTVIAVVHNSNAADRLHLRSEPRDDAKSLGKYYNGVRLTNAGQPVGDWIPVKIGSLTGYMKKQYLELADTPGSSLSSIKSAMPIMKVSNPNTAANLNLREKPSTTSSSLGVYSNGTKVVLMGFNDEWAHVIVDGKMGFMMGIYLK